MGTINIKRVGEIMHAVLSEQAKQNDPLRLKDLLAAVASKFNFTDYEKEILAKSRFIRWHTVVHYYSIDCVKAGYIQKAGGRWSITKQGKKALALSPEAFIRSAMVKYRDWKKSQKSAVSIAHDGGDEAGGDKGLQQTAYDQALEQARTEIEEHIDKLNAYDFQKLVAELLRAMTYHVPYVAPPGADGGIDLVAYKDPLGTSTPRLRVQVKHRDNKVDVKEVRELEGLLRKEGDMGLIVSSGGFTSAAMREIQVSSKHIETMDLNRLITLWQEHYDHVREPGVMLLPLVKMFFLAPTEE
ncbi:MAG: restriction endonuclease [Kiritimatiellaeota bacterium]|nr:restriction endonuclease [Kiritimatiellota bacterium]